MMQKKCKPRKYKNRKPSDAILNGIAQSEVLVEQRRRIECFKRIKTRLELRCAARDNAPSPEQIQAAAGVEAVQAVGLYAECAGVHPDFPRGDFFAATWLVLTSRILTCREVECIVKLGAERFNKITAAARHYGQVVIIGDDGGIALKPRH